MSDTVDLANGLGEVFACELSCTAQSSSNMDGVSRGMEAVERWVSKSRRALARWGGGGAHSEDVALRRRASTTVLFVVHQTGRRANGGLRSLLAVVERLTEVQPVVALHSATGVYAELVALGIEVIVLDSLEGPANWRRASGAVRHRGKLARVARLVRSNWRVAEIVHRRGIGVVHCNDSRSALSAVVGARLAGAAVALNVRDTVLRNRLQWAVLTRCVQETIVLSEDMAARLRSKLWLSPVATDRSRSILSGAPLTVSRSVVDPAEFSPLSAEQRERARAAVGLTPAHRAIGVVGALMPKKQQLQLLRHLAAHPEQLPERSRLYFVGDSDPQHDAYSAECVEVSEHPQLRSRIQWIGYAGAINDWYCRLDVTLICSRHEGLARAMIESLACGTPVVSFDCCSAREVLERPRCGLVAPQGQYTELMMQVRRLLTDRALHEEYSFRAVERARELFEPTAVASVYERAYLRLATAPTR